MGIRQVRQAAAAYSACRRDKKKSIYPKTINDWSGKFKSQVLSGPPGNRMRDKKGMLLDLDIMVYDYVVSNNMLGGTVTHASIAKAATDAYKVMVRAGRVDAALDFKVSAS